MSTFVIGVIVIGMILFLLFTWLTIWLLDQGLRFDGKKMFPIDKWILAPFAIILFLPALVTYLYEKKKSSSRQKRGPK